MSVIENLHLKKAGGFALNIPRVELSDNRVNILMGPSGCGKSTFLKALCGLEPTSSFTWKFSASGEELDLAKMKIAERKLGVVFQQGDLFPHMTVFENLMFAAKSRGLRGLKAQDEIQTFVRALDVESALDKPVVVLSGGETQRVAIARSLIGSPRMLLLDEPFSSLDQQNRDHAVELVKNVLRERKIPALLITHNSDDTRAFDGQLIRMAKGEIIV